MKDVLEIRRFVSNIDRAAQQFEHAGRNPAGAGDH
jgi:hypothetical protein